MKYTLETPGQRPDWIKNDDVILKRYYTWDSDPARQRKANGLGQNLDDPTSTNPVFHWNDPSLYAIELEDDHPYLRATEQGLKYWPGGNCPPADIDPEGLVMFRTESRPTPITCGPDRLRWNHMNLPGDVIGYTPIEDYPYTNKRGDKARILYSYIHSEQRPYSLVEAISRCEGYEYHYLVDANTLEYGPNKLYSLSRTPLTETVDTRTIDRDVAVRLTLIDGKPTDVSLLA